MRIAEKYELLNTIATTVVINKSPDDLEEYLRECANHGIDKSDPKACGKLLNVITEPGLIDIWRRADDFKPVKPIKPEGKLEVEDAVKIAAAVLTPHFFQAREHGDEASDSVHLYNIKDVDDKVCSIVNENAKKGDIGAHLSAFVSDTLNRIDGKLISSPEANLIVDSWLRFTRFDSPDDTLSNDQTKYVYPYGNPYINPKEWVKFRSTLSPDKDCAFPILTEMFSRVKYGPQVAALIYGTYTGQYKGRQSLWLYGEGKEGKSTLITTLCSELFGANYGYKALQDAQVKESARFVNGFVEDAKVIVVPDCKDLRLLEDHIVKSLSGRRDTVVSEKKGKQAKTIKIDATLLVVSNFKPMLEDAEYATSRILLTSMSKKVDENGEVIDDPDPDIADKIIKEIPGFLYWAETMYKELIKGDSITTPPEYNEDITDLINSTDSERKRAVSENLVFEQDRNIKAETLKGILRNSGVFRDSEIAGALNWFKKAYPTVTLKVHNNTTQYFSGVRAKTDKEKQAEADRFDQEVMGGNKPISKGTDLSMYSRSGDLL